MSEALTGREALLNGFDVQVWSILRHRRGSDQALSLAMIISRVWPEEYTVYQGSVRWMRNRERAVKGAIEKLRDAGKLIAANRSGFMRSQKPGAKSQKIAKPTGYFIATSADEIEQCIRPYRSQAIKMFRTASHMLGRDAHDVVGQMQLALEAPEHGSGARGQVSE
ncbi:MAG TPA: hypothetical protein VGZ29_05640 [Terriglobia bacterium]|nr:hypothetical protein [Terriglobia bacterium]